MSAKETPISPNPTASSFFSTPRQKKEVKDCSRCVQWLSEALNADRPRELLQALGARDVQLEHPRGRNASEEGESRSMGVSALVVMDPQHRQQPQPQQQKKEAPKKNVKEAGAGLQRFLTTTTTMATSASTSTSTDTVPPTPTKDMEVTCTWCGEDGPEGQARAYVRGPDPVGIVLCANRLKSKEEVEEVLVHELTHAYDVHVSRLDLRQCEPLAYSEVRAAREAECYTTSRFLKSSCIRDKATMATKNMFPKEGGGCVNAVFEGAMRDVAPFGNKRGGGVGGWSSKSSSSSTSFGPVSPK